MLDPRKLRIVARFELLEALRSRLFLVVLALYGAGAATGSFVFLKVLAAAENAARRALATSGSIPESHIPDDLVRAHALPFVGHLIEDDALRSELLSIPPLAIFYGYMALLLVPLLVLATSAGAIASDLSSGAARFALFRCDRATWATGKLLGQETLLAAGLLAGALLAGTVGMLMTSEFDLEIWAWLVRTSFRAWLYGSGWLGIFLGFSFVVRKPMAARALALFTLIGFAVLHGLLTAEFINAHLPGVRFLAVLLPTHHRDALWSPHLGTYLVSVGAVLAIGTAAFTAGLSLFRRRDA